VPEKNGRGSVSGGVAGHDPSRGLPIRRCGYGSLSSGEGGSQGTAEKSEERWEGGAEKTVSYCARLDRLRKEANVETKVT